MGSIQQPLSTEEINELSSILRSFPSKEAMNLETLDGFFTALHCCPHIVAPSKYMHRIYGNKKESDASPFSDIKEAERFFSLLMCNWNSVAARMQYATFELLLKDTGGCWENFAKYWAGGFLMGMSLSDGAFDEILKSEKESFLLTPIFALSHDKSFNMENVIEEEMTPELRKELVDMLQDNIPVIYAILRDPDFEEKSKKINQNNACSSDFETKHSKCKVKRTLH